MERVKPSKLDDKLAAGRDDETERERERGR
jgi:hypothetical protein